MFSSFDKSLFLSFFKSNYKKFQNTSFFITGATGFIGKWIIGALIIANENFFLKLNIYILSRDPEKFRLKYKYISKQPYIFIIKGDVRKSMSNKELNFLPKNIDFFIHAASDVASKISPIQMFDVCINGTKNILELAKLKNAKDFLLISSGAIYGIQPDEISSLNEKYQGLMNWPNKDSYAYGFGKIGSEWLTQEYSKKNQFRSKIARCFAFVGPYMEMDKHFAIGNFIRDASAGKDIFVKGDGEALRTYLYAGELSIWLLEILINSSNNSIYNVGGSEIISISDLATKIKNIINPKVSIVFNENENIKSDKYIPDINKIKKELNLFPKINIDKCIIETHKWYTNSYE